MIGRPWLGAVTHIAGCPEREIDIATAGTCPIIFPAATYKQKPMKMQQEAYQIAMQKESGLSIIKM